MERILRFSCPSSITDIVSVNDSFDSCTIRVMYTGANRNGTFFSKEVVERALPTMAYCPVVTHYDVEANEIGGHDVDIAYREDGTSRLINLTEPVGVIPASPHTYWQDVQEQDGVIHSYLCTQALIWKRSAAYEKLHGDGITDQSMEVTIAGGHDQDGLFVVDDFTFNAFCLISVEPCFESASAMFSVDEISEKFSLMMDDVKREFSSALLDVNCGTFEKEKKGGDDRLTEKIALLEEFGLKQEDIDFNIDEMTVEELREKFEAMNRKAESYALAEQFIEELRNALRSEVYNDPYWGDMPRYSYVDCDMEKGEVYAYDCEDWKLYGLPYAMNGDNVVVEFEKRKRMKCSFVEFDEGEQPGIFGGLFSMIADRAKEKEQELIDKYNAMSDTAAAEKTEMQKELDELRQFKFDVEEADRETQREELFSQFEDLNGNEQFEALREDRKKYELDVLEEKCFAIRGRVGVPVKFSVEKPAKLLVGGTEMTQSHEPYGNLFKKYGTES